MIMAIIIAIALSAHCWVSLQVCCFQGRLLGLFLATRGQEMLYKGQMQDLSC